MKITKDWLDDLTLKQQTVLLSSIRGCDGADKHDFSKKLVRKLRSEVLNCAVGSPNEFMENDISEDELYNFSKSIDKYPVHFLLHLIHASEVIGYKHPEQETKIWWFNFYESMVHGFHMNIESEEQMDERLKDGVITICHKT